jgi:aminoglycoside 6'-N-acetyltransferase I
VKAEESFRIRPVRPEDAAEWLRLRCAHWPNGAEDHPGEIADFFGGRLEEPAAVFLVESGDQCIAVMELSIRTDLEGAAGHKTGYVEGLYVMPRFRSGNVVRLLLRRAQEWARENGCTAFASDRAGRIVIDRRYGEGTGE